MTSKTEEQPGTIVHVYGFEQYADVQLSPVGVDGLSISFKPVEGLAHLNEGSPDLVILPIEAPAQTEYGTSWTSDPDVFSAISKAVDRALRRSAMVCFILSSKTPTADSQYYAADTERHDMLSQNLVGYSYLASVGGMLRTLRRVEPFLEVRRAELQPSFDQFGAASAWVESRGYPGIEKKVENLAVVERARAAVTMVAHTGRLLWLPMRAPRGVDECSQAAIVLARSILTLGSRTIGDEPAWAANYVFEGEQEVRDEVAALESKLTDIKPQFDSFRSLRRVIWTRDDELHLAVVDFLRELGFDIEVFEQYKEDFWIREGSTRKVIGEVKAFNPNVKPTNLAPIVSHRSIQQLDDDFPALFIVRPFAARNEIVDQAIEPNVRMRAYQDNVTVMRTLDLAHLHGLIQRKAVSVSDILAAFDDGGGWLRMTADGLERLTK